MSEFHQLLSLSHSFSPAVGWIYSFLKQWTSETRLWGVFFFFPCWIFEQPHVPFPGSVFIYLLELKCMGGRALYLSMLCFLMQLHSEALMPFGQMSFLHFRSVHLYFFCCLFFVFFLFLSPSSYLLPAGFFFFCLSQIILPGFRNKFIFCKRIFVVPGFASSLNLTGFHFPLQNQVFVLSIFFPHHVQSLFWFWHHQYQMYKRFLLTNTRYIWCSDEFQ